MGLGAHSILATRSGHRPQVRHMAASFDRSAIIASDAASATTASHAAFRSCCATPTPSVPGGFYRLEDKGLPKPFSRNRGFTVCAQSSQLAGIFAPPCLVCCEAVAGVGFPPHAGRRNLIQQGRCRVPALLGVQSILPRPRRPLEPGRYAPAGSRHRVFNRQSNSGVQGLHVFAPFRQAVL